jgi:uroporphyrinogen-III synthase
MTDPEPTLLLTRPEPQSKAFLSQCETVAGRRLPAVISPVMKIELADDLPDLDRYVTIVFTSGNGVRSALSQGSLAGRTVFTVGEKTAELARAAGAEAEALGEDVDAFVAAARRVKGPALLCRGVHSRGDLAGRLSETRLRIDEVLLYDQVACPLSTAAQQLLAGSGPVVAPVFSPRTARLLGGHGVIAAPLTIVAMSEAVAESWEGPGLVRVAAEPTSEAMCALVLELL